MQNVLSFKKFRKWNSTFNIFPLKYYNQIVQWRSVETCVTHFFGYKIGIFKTEIFELCRVKTVHTDFTCPLSLDFCRNSKSGKVHFGAKFEIEWNPFSKNVFCQTFHLTQSHPIAKQLWRKFASSKLRREMCPIKCTKNLSDFRCLWSTWTTSPATRTRTSSSNARSSPKMIRLCKLVIFSLISQGT